MPKIPRNISGRSLIKLLSIYGCSVSRQTGSHIRLISVYMGHDHDPIKIGTLNSLLKDISEYLHIPKNTLIEELFQK
jgi:predicted RNA binding protein YcfA (HicA-like mRNA interferase family)